MSVSLLSCFLSSFSVPLPSGWAEEEAPHDLWSEGEGGCQPLESDNDGWYLPSTN